MGINTVIQPDTNSLNSPLSSREPAVLPDNTQAFQDLGKSLNTFAALIGTFCPENIPDLGAMILNLEELIQLSDAVRPKIFFDVATACKDYVESMTLESIHNTKPVEETLVLLRSILNHLKRGENFIFDYSDVLGLLAPTHSPGREPAPPAAPAVPAPEQEAELPMAPEPLSEEDATILLDFASEAEENLDTIEINLIELEQAPHDKEIINNIFRPFHTIKGVSGFLSLPRINRLAHATENLLDGARSGDFLINHAATDAILESVDTLKQLIAGVRQGAANRVRLPDNSNDQALNALLDKLKKLQAILAENDRNPLGEILVRKGVLQEDSLNESLEFQKNNPGERIGEILIHERKADAGQIDAALKEQNLPRKQMADQVKVSTDKLDDLVNFAGELVIAQSMLRQKTAGNPSLSQSVTQLGQIVSSMQHIAMSMRMIPIKATFMKMIRLVRDLSRKSGKDVNLTMTGEDTEIDRNVVDALYEPMVHMIRNAVDHGIESPDQRHEKGKPTQGIICLRAFHKGGHIIIEIEDDGNGLDRERILEKAVSKGLITGREQLTDSQIFDLILEPGFSTARQITDVSGRGVGMDVVKDAMAKFRGQLTIESSKGKGTRFVISLPLTLAIIDGMLVRVGHQTYVIPTTTIQKAFKPDKSECFTISGKGEIVRDRDDLIPLVRLNDLFNSAGGHTQVWEGIVVVVESKDEKRALLVDELLGKNEYVIKSLGGSLEEVKGFAGGAILADGRVGLILDIHGIFSLAATGGDPGSIADNAS
ncbi:MAG: chemotaxis protein CheA [Pseudomonadota bacterium]